MKKIILIIKSIIIVLKARKQLREDMINPPNVPEKHLDLKLDKPVIIQEYPTYLLANLFIFCCTVLASNAYYLVIDKHFYQLSPETQDFILYHEMGHIINKDLEKEEKCTLLKSLGRLLLSIFFTKIKQEEIQADLHAVSVVGIDKSINALKELNGYVKGNKELKLRIKYLEDLQ